MSCSQTLHPTTNNQLRSLPAAPRYFSPHQWCHFVSRSDCQSVNPGSLSRVLALSSPPHRGSVQPGAHLACVILYHLMLPRILFKLLFVANVSGKSCFCCCFCCFCCCQPFHRAHDTLEKQTGCAHLHISTGVVWLHSYLTAERTAGRRCSPQSGTWDSEVLNGWAVFITNFLTPDDLQGLAVWPAHVKTYRLYEQFSTLTVAFPGFLRVNPTAGGGGGSTNCLHCETDGTTWDVPVGHMKNIQCAVC